MYPPLMTRTVPTASCVLDPNHRHEHLVKCSTHELTGKTHSVSIRRLDTTRKNPTMPDAP